MDYYAEEEGLPDWQRAEVVKMIRAIEREAAAAAVERIQDKAAAMHLDLIYVGPGSILDDPWKLLSRSILQDPDPRLTEQESRP